MNAGSGSSSTISKQCTASTHCGRKKAMEWLRRSLSRSPNNTQTSQSNSSTAEHQQEQRIYGITEELINHVKSFTIDTFKNFPLQGSPFFFFPSLISHFFIVYVSFF